MTEPVSPYDPHGVPDEEIMARQCHLMTMHSCIRRARLSQAGAAGGLASQIESAL